MISFVVQKTDLLNGQVTRFYFHKLWCAKLFIMFRESLMARTGMVYDYKIKLLGYEC